MEASTNNILQALSCPAENVRLESTVLQLVKSYHVPWVLILSKVMLSATAVPLAILVFKQTYHLRHVPTLSILCQECTLAKVARLGMNAQAL